MDPVTLKMAANLGLSLAKSKTVQRLLIVAALVQAVVWSFVLFVPAYLMASVAPSMHQVATEEACTAGTGADSSVPLPAGAAGAQLTVRMATWNVLKSNSASKIVAKTMIPKLEKLCSCCCDGKSIPSNGGKLLYRQ